MGNVKETVPALRSLYHCSCFVFLFMQGGLIREMSLMRYFRVGYICFD
jgi:hypothetical protein